VLESYSVISPVLPLGNFVEPWDLTFVYMAVDLTGDQLSDAKMASVIECRQ
jgi:hypothetical protein